MGPGKESVPHQREVSALTEIWEPDDPALRYIFLAIPTSVGVPGVHLLWRLLANFPQFLTAVWPAIADDLGSQALNSRALELIRRSFLSEAVGLPSHKAFRGDLVRAEIDAELREHIEHFNDVSQIGLARLLVVAAVAVEGAGQEPTPDPGRLTHVGAEQQVNAVYVPPLRPEETLGKAREVLDRIEREHGLPWLDDYYRSLGRVPDYLAAAWNAISPIVGDPAYLARGGELARIASAAGGRLSTGLAATPALQGLDVETRRLTHDVLKSFAELVLPQTLVDVTLIKALTSGPERATVEVR
jgi:hypothetical protein